MAAVNWAGSGAVLGAERPQALAISVTVAGPITKLRLRLSRGVRVSVFTLAAPYRLVLDFPEIDFRLPANQQSRQRGIIRDFRTGLVAAGQSRMVFDVAAPFKLVDVRAERLDNDQSIIHLDLGRVSAGSFRAQGVPPSLPPAASLKQAVFERRPSNGAKLRKRPLVAIDPGHGGPDPGAVSRRGIMEKSVVLAVALKLARALRADGRYEVVLTRKRDVFVSLDDRVLLSRQRKADLFLSLHADALASQTLAASIRGASVYTLSKVASDKRAQQVADKENATDALAGLPIAPIAARGRVEAILFDLMRRETAEFSLRLREHLVRRLQRAIRLTSSPRRSAAFKVLRQPDTPAALIELGYMSNPADVREMSRATWQQAAARAIAIAVKVYFDER